MKLDAQVPPQPPLDQRTLVRAQVVQNGMNRVIGRRGALDTVEKPNEFPRVAPGPAGAAHRPVEEAQGGIQARRAVPNVVMRLALRDSRLQEISNTRSCTT